MKKWIPLIMTINLALAPPLLTGNRSEMRKVENEIKIQMAEFLINSTYEKSLRTINDYQELEELLDKLDTAKDILDKVWYGPFRLGVLDPSKPELIKKIEDLRLGITARFDMVVARIEELGANRSEIRRSA